MFSILKARLKKWVLHFVQKEFRSMISRVSSRNKFQICGPLDQKALYPWHKSFTVKIDISLLYWTVVFRIIEDVVF